MSDNIFRNSVIVTSFASDHWNKFANKTVSSMRKNFEGKIICYIDPPHTNIKMENIEIISTDIYKKKMKKIIEYESMYKEQLFKDIDMRNIPKGKKFLWQASRFANKIFSIIDALSHSKGSNYLIWIDSDVTIKSDLVDGLKTLNIDPNKYWSYLMRPGVFPENGFMLFNLKHSKHEEFMDHLESLYMDGNIFKLQEWHDCFAMNHVANNMEIKYGDIMNNINNLFYNGEMDPANNSEVGNFISHNKGISKLNSKDSKIKKYVKKIIKKIIS